ncbi:hypothetical protein EDD18DRAFT_740018 [Armillaria luteobubalina]|uniref:Uncharacterized protein n=1 Tax=Armillaria luteobubalina TaxID=153913 RepID=A0AA39TVA9_9AGAR|nr:hypothetical protein EDD18DRAFT_740018 [Armillaria luteobubalina]
MTFIQASFLIPRTCRSTSRPRQRNRQPCHCHSCPIFQCLPSPQPYPSPRLPQPICGLGYIRLRDSMKQPITLVLLYPVSIDSCCQGIEMLENALKTSPSSVAVAEPCLFNLSTLYELRPATGADRKSELLIQVVHWSGDGLRTTCLKMPPN